MSFSKMTIDQQILETGPSQSQGRLAGSLGQSNSMMQGLLNQRIQGLDRSFVLADGLAMTTNVESFRESNVFKAMNRLVVTEGWDPEFAAAWLGQAVVETGNADLSNLDVVEEGSGAGRGMFQYTGARRGPYDRARQQALLKGTDPNDINWQIDYALNDDNPGLNFDSFREGLTDPEQNYTFNKYWGNATGETAHGESYGNKFNNANQLMSSYGEDRLGGYSRALTGEFTRPGVHHLDRREKASKHILEMYTKAIARQKTRLAGGGGSGSARIL